MHLRRILTANVFERIKLIYPTNWLLVLVLVLVLVVVVVVGTVCGCVEALVEPVGGDRLVVCELVGVVG
jgi:hypothetical protein